MSKSKRKFRPSPPSSHVKKPVTSLLDVMQDGREYASLVDVAPKGLNLRDELMRAIAEIETIRKHPLIVYAANVINVPAGALTEIGYVDEPVP